MCNILTFRHLKNAIANKKHGLAIRIHKALNRADHCTLDAYEWLFMYPQQADAKGLDEEKLVRLCCEHGLEFGEILGIG